MADESARKASIKGASKIAAILVACSLIYLPLATLALYALESDALVIPLFLWCVVVSVAVDKYGR